MTADGLLSQRWLVATRGKEPSGDTHDWTYIRVLDDNEFNAVVAASGHVKSLVDSPFWTVRRRLDDYLVTEANFQDLPTALGTSDAGGDLHADLQQAMADWLSAFSMFIDRTRTRLARDHGSQSDEVARWDTAASAEFDENPAYRFSVKLRNYTLHCGAPINHVSYSKAEGESAAVEVQFDASELLENYDAWGAKVSPDLRAAPARFDVVPVVASATQSCAVLYAKFLLGQAAAAEAAAGLIRRTDEEAANEGGRALLVTTFFEEANGDPKRLNVTFPNGQRADRLMELIAEARATVRDAAQAQVSWRHPLGEPPNRD